MMYYMSNKDYNQSIAIDEIDDLHWIGSASIACN